MAASLLRTAGLPELVAASLEEYEAIAIGLAREQARLASLRERLRECRTASKLFDAGELARNLESAYATMVESHRRGEMPRSFRVG